MKEIIELPPLLKKLGGIFFNNGYTLYMAGDSVLNTLLGLRINSYEVCSFACIHDVVLFLRPCNFAVIESTSVPDVLEILIKENDLSYKVLYTAFHSELYTHSGKNPSQPLNYISIIQKDAQSRYFTINSLYANVCTGEIYDTTGRGLSDLFSRMISPVLSDPSEAIKSDGLILLRMIRMSCELNFQIHPLLKQSAQLNVSCLQNVPSKRITAELIRIMLSDTAFIYSPGSLPHKNGIMLLEETGLLDMLFPCLFACKNVFQNTHYHIYDVYHHCLESYAVSQPDLCVRLASLLHDVGKPVAFNTNGKMYGHESIGAELAEEALRNLSFDNNIIKDVMLLIKNHMFDLDNKAKPLTVKKKAAQLGIDLFRKLMEVRRADFIGSGKPMPTVESADKWQQILDEMITAHTPFCTADLNITNEELTKAIGIDETEILDRIRESLLHICIAKPSQNCRNHLIFHAREQYKSLYGTERK